MSIYYNPQRLESFNSLFNFIIGDRGKGKTFYYAKLRPIERFIKHGEQFVYLRRYKNELKTISTFFDDVRSFFPEHELVMKNGVFMCDGKVMGYSITLATANMLKGTTFPKVQTIVFDEFILEKGYIRYLPNEVRTFLNFYETVARLRPDVKAFFLGNSISIVNPYFVYWKIMPNTNDEITKVKKSTREGNKGRWLMVVEILQDDRDKGESSYRETKNDTDFAEVTMGTDYHETANENKFSDDVTDFLEKRTPEARFMFTVVYMGVKYGVWLDMSVSKWFVSNKYDKNSPRNYAITTDDFKVNMFLVDNLGKFNGLKMMKDAFTSGYLMFENIHIKSEMYDVMKLLGC